MPPFDFDAYLANRAAADNKLQQVIDASNEKVAQLHETSATKAAELPKTSWVDQLGLEPGGFMANRVNDAASLVSGASRLAGQMASLPVSVAGVAAEGAVQPEDYAAWNRHKTGTATTEDYARLDRSPLPGDPTIRQRMEFSEKARAGARRINDTADVTGIVNQANRQGLSEDLGQGFDENWAKVQSGQAGQIASGLGGLIFNAASALAQNPSAVREYVLENAPQLLIGAAGKAGQVGLAASNVGYAVDEYQKGIENYQKANGGQLPPDDVRQKMAVQAASLALAEEGGDLIGLGAARALGHAGEDVARAGFRQSMKNVGVAALEGAAGETPTEAYQQYTEGQIEGKPATAREIYEAGVIGGASGAHLSGGIAAVGETIKPASQGQPKPAPRAGQSEIDALREQAIETGDVSALVSKAPDHAIAALYGNSQKEGATEEAKQANLQKADAIVGDLTTRQQALFADLKEKQKTDPELASPESDKVLNDLADLNHTIRKVQQVHGNLQALVRPAAKVQELVDAADAGKDPKAAEQVINLSMASPDALTTEHVQQLVNNKANGLTTEQRDYLRQFDAARIAQNDARNLKLVSDEILNGSPDNLGLKQYQDWIGSAISRGDTKTAQKYMGMLESFAQDHAEKARVTSETLAKGKNAQVVRTTDGRWIVSQKFLSRKQLKDNGGAFIEGRKSVGYVDAIKAEAVAISATSAAMQAAYATKFTSNNNTSTTKTGASHVENVPPQGANQDAKRQAAEVQGAGTAGKVSEPVAAAPAARAAAAPVQAARLSVEERAKAAYKWLENPPADYTTEGAKKHVAWAKKQMPRIEEALAAARKAGDMDREDRLGDVRAALQNVIEKGEQVIAGDAHLEEQHGPQDAGTDVPLARTSVDQGVSDTSVNQTEEDLSHSEGHQSTEKRVESISPDGTVPRQVAPTETQTAESTNPHDSTPESSASADVSVVSGVDKSPEGTSYQSRNLVRDFFRQTAGAEGDTQRPLATVKDFLSGFTLEGALKFLNIKELSPTQEAVLTNFKSTAERWFDTMKSNLVKRVSKADAKSRAEDFYFNDMMQFLLRETETGVDVVENVKTAMAYAAYSWIAENAGRSPFNSDQEINAILDRDETAIVDPDERALLRDVGIRQNVVINALGQRAVAALGLKAVKDAPADLQARFESAIGSHVYKLLLDLGIVDRTPISGEALAKLGMSVEKQHAENQFVKMAVTKDGAFHPTAVEISAASKNTQGVLDKLFSVEAGLKEPRIGEPFVFEQKTTKNTNQRVPEVLAKIMQAENDTPFFVRQDMWALMQQLDDEMLMRIAGAEDTADKHIYNAKGLIANRDSLAREVERFRSFVGGMKDPEAGLYFEHVVWKQQRVGIATNVINPQTSKVHRHMLYRQAWDTKVDTTDQAQMQNFFLRVGEGLGVKTDKQGNEQSLVKAFEKIDAAETKAAVDVLVQMLQGEALGEEHQATLLAGVQKGGEAMHSLDALMALAHFQFALANGKTEFNTQLMGEVDGVTNGPMLTHLLLGAAGSVDELFDLLNRGGFYQLGNDHSQYNQWRGTPGHLDLYENTIRNVLDNVNTLLREKDFKKRIDSLLLPSVYAFTGRLQNDDTREILKAGRNIIKTPLTAMVFGSSVPKAISSMASGFVESIYDAIEKTAAGDEKALSERDLIDHLNKLLGNNPLPRNITVQDLMKYEFRGEQLKALQDSFRYTLGKAVEKTMREDFAVFMTRRQEFNQAAQLSFEIYNAARTALREKAIEDLMAAGEIKFRVGKDGKKTPIHTLTTAQEAQIAKALAALAPVMHTPLSKESGSRAAGLNMSKSDRKLSQDPTYAQEVLFGQPTPDGKQRVNTHGYEQTSSNPGVAMAVMSTHSADSAISHHEGVVNTLNVHDAHGTGVGSAQEVAQKLNHSTWTTMLNYSSANEVFDAFARTVRGFAHQLREGKLPPATAEHLKQALQDFARKNKLEEVPSIADTLAAIKTMAYQADDMKLKAMEQMQAVDQYAMEGGNYQVTDDDRAQAAAKLAALQPELVERDRLAAEEIDALLEGKTTEKITPEENIEVDEPIKASPFGAIGESKIESDKDLVKVFRAEPVLDAERVIQGLYRKFKNDASQPNREFNLVLLQRLQGLIGKNVTVKFITPDSKADAVLEMPAGPSRAWFVSKDGKQEVYVLAPEFAASGLTAETLLHELTHVALAQTIANPSAEAKALLQDLEALRMKALAHAEKEGLAGQFKAALGDLQEFTTWGMTNQEFQQKVLQQISMQSKTKKVELVTGMKAFIKTLVGLVFGGSNKTSQAITVNGLTILVGNVSGLIAAAEKSQGQADLNLSMAAASTHTYSTLDIFEALDNGQGDITPTFAASLRGLLGGIVDKLHGPFGTFKAQLMKDTTDGELGVWFKAMYNGKAPFASKSIAAGFRISSQELFALEQVEVTVRAAIDGNEANTKMAYRELAALYQEAYQKIKVDDLMTLGGTRAEAQALHDFIFKMEKNNGDRSDYLARFAALGLAHEGFNSLLKFDTKTTKKVGKSFAERLQSWFENILAFFQEKVTSSYAGQRADVKLNALVSQLVEIEAKHREALANPSVESAFFTKLEEVGNTIVNAVRNAARDVMTSKAVKSNRPLAAAANMALSGAGAAVRVIAGRQIKATLDALSDLRDRSLDEQYGIAAGLLNEWRGPSQVYEELVRARKYQEGKRKNIIEDTAKTTLSTFSNSGRGLTKDHKAGISQALLRTGAHVLLDPLGLPRLEVVLTDKAELAQEIAALKAQLPAGTLGNVMAYQAEALGFYKATGIDKSPFLHMNAYGIARLMGTAWQTQVTEEQAQQLEPVIAQLVALHGIEHTEQKRKDAAAAVLHTEGQRTDGNGLEYTLGLHAQLEKGAAERNFEGGKMLMVHGYTPEIYNPHIEVVTANAVEGADLEAKGYVKGGEVRPDPHDPVQETKHLYVLRDGGRMPWLSGIVSMTGTKAKGAKMHSGYLNPANRTGVANAAMNAQVINARAQALQQIAAGTQKFDARQDQGERYMAPLFNANGEVVNFRDLMLESTKDTLLERDNRFETILGTLAGSVFDKATAGDVNKEAISIAKQQFDKEYVHNKDAYMEVSSKAKDPQLREIWDMLPPEAKAEVRKVWGRDEMWVRKDTLDIMFGYRKLSLADAFDRDPEVRKAIEEGFVQLAELFFGPKAAMRVRQGERVWQELVKEAKDNIVVKTGVVLLGNIWSNFSALWIRGVPIKDMVHHHLVALKGATAYMKDSSELRRLQQLLAVGYTQGKDNEMQREVIRLQDALARNPVGKLIEAGLMPSIVDDVEQDDNIYSYKSLLARKTEKYTDMLNPTLVGAAKTLYMTHDTPLYKGLARATQLSDFVARYALYQHLTTRAKDPVDTRTALHDASETFVNYDVLSHRKVQYANDMGLVMFTKYFIRIQRVLGKAASSNPGRYYLALILSKTLGLGPIVLQSRWLSHLGNNPFRSGALDLFGTEDGILTMSEASKLLK